MDNPRTLGIVPVALTIQVVMAPDRLEALLSAAERKLGRTLAERVEAIVRTERLGYFPALDFFEDHPGMDPELINQVKALAAQIRKRVKREVQTHLWPVFSSVQIERATTLAFTLPRVTPAQPDALARLAQHYFPNAVRLELVLTTLDKQHHLEEVEQFSSSKVVRNLRDAFESVNVTATRRLSDPTDPGHNRTD
ncbi:MAG TPA: hypothetical protein VN277_03300 [Acidiferrobacterales bacterium]|nr:hypothetical protein [Acidiferrobacterales bacterium]